MKSENRPQHGDARNQGTGKDGGAELGERIDDIVVRDKGKLANRHITMITLGGIIGASLFVGSGNVVRAVGPAAIIAYLIGGLLVFLAMRMLGEMAARKPAVGSFMEYANESMGGYASYLTGWLYWYYWAGIIAYEAVIGGGLLNGWFPAVPTWAWSILLVAVFIMTNLFSVRIFGEIEFWLASIKVVTIIVFLVVGALFVLHLWPTAADHDPGISNLWAHDGFAPMGVPAIFIAIATVIFSYFGTEIAVMASAESVDPARGINQATKTVIWRILLFFVGGVLIIVMAVPWNELPDPSITAPFAYIFGMFGLPGASTIMEIVLFTAVISVLNSGLYSAPRMMAALADKGFAPRFVAKRSRYGTPVVALFASCVAALIAIIANYAGDKGTVIFDFIMNSGGLVALFIYVFIALAQWRMRLKLTPEQRKGLKIRSWLTPYLNILVIALVLVIVVIMIIDPNDGGTRVQVWTSLILTAALFALWPAVKSTLAKRGVDTRPAMDVRREQGLPD
ncbi:amino acid permease [Brevibacterium sp. 50QC2O2]|uniref:amino acid permease n=1 Tax=unclassified Brevibacterium TaxID=2614124 RepID=UPI00211B79ED|nr:MULTISPECIES: amino acid permease [unclassified Brevibacterium]MCQ9368784.1 amino acid permease [Brevibacterium sp. 91QC2O2]MCQ9388571.1 amino acid permease [Brevibacterium sp. 50QC2O2]